MSTLEIGLSALGFFLFLFVFWRRLKEDYASRSIFTLGFYLVLGFVLGIACLKLYPPFQPFWFWLGLSGAMGGLFLGFYRFKMRFFELWEAFTLGFLYWVTWVLLLDSILKSDLASLLGFVVVGSLIFFFYFLETKYKKFTWYKSGRLGFTGLFSLGTFFLIRSLVAIFRISVLSLNGKVDSLISALAAFTLFLTLFNLGRQKS